MKKALVLIFFLSLLTVSGLRISSNEIRRHIEFQPGAEYQNYYIITNEEGYVSNYQVVAEPRGGADLTEYFTITPNYFTDVASGDSREFRVDLRLPQDVEVPGESLTVIKVSLVDFEGGGGLVAVPSVGASFYVYILYPTLYYEWDIIQGGDMNVDETKEWVVSIKNLGEPTITKATATFDFYNLATGEKFRTLTSASTDIKSWEERTLRASFDSTGLEPGNYRLIAAIDADGSQDYKERNFTIGYKYIDILNFSDLFEYNAISKLNITIESKWNAPIKGVHAVVSVYDLEGARVAEFTSLTADLYNKEKKDLQAFFDTTGLEKGQYRAVVKVLYEGKESTLEKIITIDENVNVPLIEEIPMEARAPLLAGIMNMVGSISLTHILVMLLLVFIVVNLVLLYKMLRGKAPVDRELIKEVSLLKDKYSESFIVGALEKKGYTADEIRKAIKKVK